MASQNQYLMALDAGTGSVRAVIFDLQGNQIATAQQEWTHQTDPNIPGSMNFNLEKNWQLAISCIAQAIKKSQIQPSDIKAISTCSMREAIVLYDSNKAPIWACGNVDARAIKEVKRLKNRDDDYEKTMYNSSGQTLSLSAVPRLLWLKENQPSIYKKAQFMTMLSDWLGFMLTGEISVEPSNAGTTGLINLETRQWDTTLLENVGLNPNLLPPVKETGERLGYVTENITHQTGLAINTPVIVGGGDVQLGCVGLGVTAPTQAAIIGGTFWQQVVNLPNAKTDPNMNVRINPHVIPPLVQAESISFFTGLTMRWFRDVFCHEEIVQAEKEGVDAYSLLESQAQLVPVGSNDVIPIFSDAMHYANWYHAAPSFINLSISPEKCNKAVLFRALEENAAIVSAYNLRQVEQFSGIKLSSIIFAGGGSKGTLWSQILADVTGLIIHVPVVKEATALGCAIAAGVGIGLYASMQQAGEQLVKIERTYYPNPEHNRLYQGHMQKWEKVYSAQLALVNHGLTESLWKAPGV
ncbi:autoinducer-2 kinase [Pasteurellaceae bacterium HPA106]|uniref:autoinducer-2 kinase n=1 Tax=Spirabiliibacterium pneumoniae TaxID=221400 RepID=UPI001AAD103B|nr:autoinducer-2 kinase [Spirabiliibacterium pneumoniae]MBE2896430.1 autoinducer-2 kinase [Spirabiliibacterium pneumoniae]